jgi:hypothetical protein
MLSLAQLYQSSLRMILFIGIGIGLAMSAVSAPIVYAASITVTTTADVVDAAGTCLNVTLASLPGPDGKTSLREAVCAANNTAGVDTISFGVNGTFTLTGAANEDNGQSGDLDIKESVTIIGNGIDNTIIDGGGIERIFEVAPSTAITFNLSNLTLQNGDTRTTTFKEGGALYLNNNVTTTLTNCRIVNNFSGSNGAIENRGNLTITGSTLSGNQTMQALGSASGGAIHNVGSLSISQTTINNNLVLGEGGGIATSTGVGTTVNITNTTISNNIASTAGGVGGNGGGIVTRGTQGAINISNSTISGNRADNYGGGAFFITPTGGTGKFTLTNVTITNNLADNDDDGTGTGGGFFQYTGNVILQNTIVAGNFNSTIAVRDDIKGTISATSLSNLIGDGTGMAGVSDGVNNNLVGSHTSPINPLLGILVDNGGTTQTYALQSGSPALDTADDAICASQPINNLDQRGIVRPQGAHCDIGAYEANTRFSATTTLTSAPNPVMRGLSVTFTTTVTSTHSTMPTGLIILNIGTNNIGPLTLTNGVATYITTTLAGGSNSITASYYGDANYDVSTSNIYTQTITAPPILYAKPISGGSLTSGTCDSWANSCDLWYALNLAVPGSNQELWVTGGVYKPTATKWDRYATFQLKNGVAVYGGFAGTESARTERNLTGNITVLSGDIDNNDVVDANGVLTTTAGLRGANTYHIVSGASGATLDAVIITGAYNNGGVLLGSGGGMFTNGGNPTITNVTFSGNYAYNGGGMYNENHSDPKLTNVTFSGNSAIGGGGMFNMWSSPTLTNVTFSGNWADHGGGMDNEYGSNPQIRNTIMWGDSGGEIASYNGATSTITNSVVQAGGIGTNIITANPLLGTPGYYGGNTRTIPLLPGSSAIDATSTNCPATDQRGITRSTPTCDIGAFESQGFTFDNLTGTPQSATITTAFATPLGLSVTSAFAEPVASGIISFTAPISGASVISPTMFTKTINPGGIVSATVTANGNSGSYNVTANAAGVATPAQFSLTNNRISTTASITSSPNPSALGQVVTFTTAVTSSLGITPTGTISVTTDSSLLFTGTLDVNGRLIGNSSALGTGNHSLVVNYLGDTNFAPSTSSIYTHAVNNPMPTLTTTSPSSAKAGGVGFTLGVTGTNFVNGATVRWNGNDRVTTWVSANRLDAVISANDIAASGTPTVTVSNPTPGGGTSNALTFNINQATTTLALDSSPNPSLIGNTVTFTATLAQFNAMSSSAVRLPRDVTPTGIVTFTIDATTNITRTMNASGIVSYTTSSLALGTRSVTATYSGDGNLISASASPLSHQVNNPTPSITSINPTSVVLNAPAFTLIVTGTNFVNGSIVRWNGNDRATSYVSATQLSAAILKADLETAGTATVTVFNSSPGGGTSNAVYLTIGKANVSLALTSSKNPTASGEVVTFTANLAQLASSSASRRPRDATPSGVVTFTIDAATNITRTLDGAGQATYATSALAVGAHTMAAQYPGDGNFNGASASITQTVGLVNCVPPAAMNRQPAKAQSGWTYFFPFVGKAPGLSAADLFVQNITVNNNSIQVILANQGNASVTDAFWVDLYINPNPNPTQVNQIWNALSSQGAVWGVTASGLPLNPNSTLALSLGDGYYSSALSNLPATLPTGTCVFVQVDSANTNTNYGAVREYHEITQGAYNNIMGIQLSAPVSLSALKNLVPSTSTTGKLPQRPSK